MAKKMTKATTFGPGDTVRHRILESPVMHVVSQTKDKVRCQWFTTTGQFQDVSFDSDSLVAVAVTKPEELDLNIVDAEPIDM